ncbi:MAG TPA: DNA polymerase III subunit gamma/tau [Methylococcaceae bacterium]|jgi:DNA polymerase-3 subunit gamma/tau|nr:DNA polymerase III subunit gamma/tau [Methylococcaceae bacterium]HIA44514.1 DNA polymerase III subunit gamma/tau [Methylococcaceae bacterium]HIB62012.1 DNA polymerase III subunit gamma/tau [Methylococcaceae bacterium]HIN69270.1 DNA polymerase III subunit gamma/tau [Methylococcales bacterium]HIO44749.1 DNA polymerase III subunit gamma/tau [Methylococcales bacterium]
MTYQALARKWRPHDFNEIVGQEAVVKSLMSALKSDRLHHAYLFTGTRGVGKTTIARVLAKALNCEDIQAANPCGQCPVCRDIDDDKYIDFLEIDAASRTKVEDTRDLIDNIQYAPSRGRYKVYLIDEVHMLSGHSFNALLKTLEEPPPHVKFLLATTDPQKIPVTVLSRCLQFSLKHLTVNQLTGQMAAILQKETIAYDAPALVLIAHVAAGSMRDGLSLLDQAIVFGEGQVSVANVQSMLGTVGSQAVGELLLTVAANDPAGVLQKIAEMADFSSDFDSVCAGMIRMLHRTALAQVVPETLALTESREVVENLAAAFAPEEVQLYYQIALTGRKDLQLAVDLRSGFEMLLLRMLAFRPMGTVSTSAEQNPGVAPVPVVKTIVKQQVSKSSEDTLKPSEASDWLAMVGAMNLGGMARELANNCILASLTDDQCRLMLDERFKELHGKKTEQSLLKALEGYLGRAVKLVIQPQSLAHTTTPAVLINEQIKSRQQAAEQAIDDDKAVRALKDRFSAHVIPGTIEPVKSSEEK